MNCDHDCIPQTIGVIVLLRQGDTAFLAADITADCDQCGSSYAWRESCVMDIHNLEFW